MNSTISRIIESITKLHGNERVQRAKHEDFMNYLRLRSQCTRTIIPTVPHRESVNDE
jgi:hypothetical protein